jgi:protein ImuA
MSFGAAEIDAVLPWGGVPLGCLHEIAGAVDDGGEDAAALGFAALWLGRLAAGQDRPVLWVTMTDDLYPPGLAALGLAIHRLVVVRPARGVQLAWAMEEGLRCPGLAGVLGEVHGMDLTAARRLKLAARGSGGTALLLNRGGAVGPATTRWRVGSAPSEALDAGVGAWRWRVALSRCRGCAVGDDGAVAAWLVEWSEETHGLAVAARGGGGSAVPQPALRASDLMAV